MSWIALSGWAMTAASLIVAVVQTYRVTRLEQRNRQQLTMFIEDANYVSFEHELLDQIAPRLNDAMLQRYLVAWHQRGCDLYRGLVDYYLSMERSFTFDDLNRVCQTPLVSYMWQEDFWRGRLVLRRENRGAPVPTERFLVRNKTPRLEKLRNSWTEG